MSRTLASHTHGRTVPLQKELETCLKRPTLVSQKLLNIACYALTRRVRQLSNYSGMSRQLLKTKGRVLSSRRSIVDTNLLFAGCLKRPTGCQRPTWFWESVSCCVAWHFNTGCIGGYFLTRVSCQRRKHIEYSYGDCSCRIHYLVRLCHPVNV